jgi:hypothetical protein
MKMNTSMAENCGRNMFRNLAKVCSNPFAKFEVSFAFGDLASASWKLVSDLSTGVSVSFMRAETIRL